MRSTPLGLGLPSPATLLFNCPIRGIMLIINRPPIGLNNDEEHYEALVKRHMKKMIRTMIFPESMLLFQQGLL